ncbi:phosphopantetheine-binding protein, partial [Enterovirga sp.]|uniref:phosphopantetheine-binding protein n=1 Tax=Enterovirga sp. TaxID=2026350 RepID=UPI002B9F1F09
IPRALLVEADPVEAGRIAGFLPASSRGFEVDRAASLAEARSRLREAAPDVVLASLSLPDGAGLSFVRELAAWAPLVVVVEPGAAAQGEEAIAAGALDFVVRGETREGSLARTLRHAIERHALASRLRVMSEGLERGVDERTAALQHRLSEERQSREALLSMMEDVDHSAKELARSENRLRGLVEQLEKLGIRAFTTEDALAALGPIMDDGPPNVAFADVDWERWAAASEVSGTPRFSLLVHASAASDRVSALRRELAALPPAMRSSRLEEVIKAALGAVLRTTPDKIPSDRPLDRLGVDSLMAVELTLGLEQEIGIKLPTALLMQGPSVGTLAAHLLHELLAIDRLEEAAVEDLSEAETDAMLEMLIASGELDLEAV